MKSKKKFLFFISIVLGIILVLWLFLKVGIDKIIKTLSFVSWWQFLLIFFINIFILFLTAKKWKIITKPYNYKANFRKILIAILGEQAISFITPIMYVGGEGIKAFLLKEDKEGKTFAKTFGLIVLDRLAEGCALLIFFLLGGIISIIFRYFFLGTILIIISIGIIFLLIFVLKIPQIFFQFLKILFPKKLIKNEEKIKEELNVVRDYVFQYGKFFNLDIFYSFLVLILKTFQIYFILLFWGNVISIFNIYFIEIIILLSGLIPTPGSIGGFEGGIAFIFSILNLPLSTALALAIILRATQIILVGLGIFLVFPYCTTKICPIISTKNDKNNLEKK